MQRTNLLMDDYADLLHTVLTFGEDVSPDKERTKTGTKSVFGHTGVYDLRLGFPLTTLRPIHWKSVVGELLWFLSGSTDVRDLQKLGVTFWDPWIDATEEDEQGYDLGWIYGYFWRHAVNNNVRDPLAELIHTLRTNPNRRMLVCSWDHELVRKQTRKKKAPPPCHVLFQVYATQAGELDLQMYQRSADCILGVPYNIASYALLLSILAKMTDRTPRYFRHVVGDAHIYQNHLEGKCGDTLMDMLAADERPAPTLILPDTINGKTSIDEITAMGVEQFVLEGYNPYTQHAIKWPVAI